MPKLLFLILPALAAGLAAGCGKQDSTPVQLSGTVNYKGAPLKGGNVTFYTDDHGAINTTINGDGTYQARLPAERVKVTVETESFNPDKNSGGGKASGGKKNESAEAKAKQERMKAEGKSGGSWTPGSFGAAPREVLLGLYTKIPQKYSFKETSGIAFDLEPGKHVQDIELKD